MKAIVSHDIDHLTFSEHYLNDFIVPKYVIRNHIELVTGKISFTEFINRVGDVFKNQWQHIEATHQFNANHKVPSTFFIGVNQGMGLNYSRQQSSYWIGKILELGCNIGSHGIEYENFEKINSEYLQFKKESQLNSFGTRLHYIRKTDNTFSNMAKVGYSYDSSEMGFKAPYKIDNMWEFPFQIMDGYIIEKPKKWQSKKLKQSCEATLKIIDQVVDMQLPYLIIDFHDCYFSDSHKTWKDWYMWLIEYLEKNKIEFVNFNQAIKELEQ